MKLVALALASVLGLSSVAFADDAPYAGPPGAMPAPAPEQLGAPADYRQPMQPQGPQGPRRAALRAQRAQFRAEVVAQFDRDGDGRLSPRERHQAVKALRRMARQLARQDRRAARMPQGPQGPGEPQVDVDVRWQR